MDTKRCDRCGREFSRPSSFSDPSWTKQKYCSLLCANRTRAERRRTRGSDTKPCEQCGAEMTWPSNYTAKQWAAKRYCNRVCAGAAQRAATDDARPPEPCPICGEPFRKRYAAQTTCTRKDCIERYRVEVSGPARAIRMRADYAAGKRKKAAGISPREVALWPLLSPHGWVWRLRWIEADAEFELDFAHRGLMLNVEIDGVEHREPRGRARDEVRDAALAAQGWRILRVSNEEVDADAAAVAERILAWGRDSRG